MWQKAFWALVCTVVSLCFMLQAENKKYRAERTRLIEERNNNYSKIRALYVKEDEIKKEIAAVRGDISANRKCKTLKNTIE